MELFIYGIGGALVGAVFAAWRLREDGQSTMQALRRIVPFSGGPRPVVPK